MKKSANKSLQTGREKKKTDQVHKKSGSNGKTPGQVIRQHIQDENDVITDEDFKNLIISSDIPGDKAHQPLELPDDNERPKDEDKDPSIIIPWDLIDE